jgi:NAD(P)-dependent dehydrogenase (short-subunit alcohol dehydrogenase family)
MTKNHILSGRVAVITGGAGVLGGSMASALAAAGAKVAILGRSREKAERKVAELHAAGAEAIAIQADVTDENALRSARERVLSEWTGIDILINAAGGNVARARTDDKPIFAMPLDAHREVLALNLDGTVVPTIIFGEAMAKLKRGCVINISSMAATQAMSGVLSYSIAKAGIDNFTKWMAVDMARRFGDGIRVNAIAPGFFITEQNKAVLIDAAGNYSVRAQNVIRKTPMGRFGEPREIDGLVVFLCSDAASFITGAVIPVDGGFSANSGI